MFGRCNFDFGQNKRRYPKDILYLSIGPSRVCLLWFKHWSKNRIVLRHCFTLNVKQKKLVLLVSRLGQVQVL